MRIYSLIFVNMRKFFIRVFKGRILRKNFT